MKMQVEDRKCGDTGIGLFLHQWGGYRPGFSKALQGAGRRPALHGDDQCQGNFLSEQKYQRR